MIQDNYTPWGIVRVFRALLFVLTLLSIVSVIASIIWFFIVDAHVHSRDLGIYKTKDPGWVWSRGLVAFSIGFAVIMFFLNSIVAKPLPQEGELPEEHSIET